MRVTTLLTAAAIFVALLSIAATGVAGAACNHICGIALTASTPGECPSIVSYNLPSCYCGTTYSNCREKLTCQTCISDLNNPNCGCCQQRRLLNTPSGRRCRRLLALEADDNERAYLEENTSPATNLDDTDDTTLSSTQTESGRRLLGLSAPATQTKMSRSAAIQCSGNSPLLTTAASNEIISGCCANNRRVWTGACGANGTKKTGAEWYCGATGCTAQECCNYTCDAFACGADSRRVAPGKTCVNGVCNAAQCCLDTCTQAFCNARATTGVSLTVKDLGAAKGTQCESENSPLAECTSTYCCAVNCGSHECESVGYTPKADAGAILCTDGTCTDTVCCDPPAPVNCGSHECDNAGYTLMLDAGVILCTDGTCTDTVCCNAPVSTPPVALYRCIAYNCEVGARWSNSTTVQCDGGGSDGNVACSDVLCCDPNSTVIDAPAVTTPPSLVGLTLCDDTSYCPTVSHTPLALGAGQTQIVCTAADSTCGQFTCCVARLLNHSNDKDTSNDDDAAADSVDAGTSNDDGSIIFVAVGIGFGLIVAAGVMCLRRRSVKNMQGEINDTKRNPVII